ncbi:DNA cytosine methyltransferase [Halobacillus litoralis]|uniref:DNA cytosine methyltransferase n=1 Tax=Halobacillus litoralis TaxID=45668 RepID=UPI001CD34C76|nr:DNA cytosine methyltransferase [Halobacillus litoralis]MCA0972094.1 DNA cytosine methyltransferase [Halobacillus litoralis]
MVKVNQRGRGKYKPASNYDANEVQRVLMNKIEEAKKKAVETESDFDIEDIQLSKEKYNITSLFCGAGGLDLGFELAGLEAVHGKESARKAFEDRKTFSELGMRNIFHTAYANDFFKEALETYGLNMSPHTFLHNKDVCKVNQFPASNIVLGGFPCPGFSGAGPRLVDDDRNFLYIQFIRSLIQTQPEFFVAENVKGMLTLANGQVFEQIVQDFEAAGYRVYSKLVNARDYGVPQLRERVFLVGVRKDLDFVYEFPEPTHGDAPELLDYVTLKDAIGDLENDPGPYYTGGYSTMYMSRNRKKTWDEQSFTIQASGRQAPLHPGGNPMEKIDKDEWIFPDGEENHRRLSVKEAARIQTFPDWYSFSTGQNNSISLNSQINKAYKQIGNAVPVKLAKEIAKPIAEYAVSHSKQPFQFSLL